MRKRTIASALGGLALLVPVTACGSENQGEQVASLSSGDKQPSQTSRAPKSQEEAMLEFAECMREHGVDVPDPKNGIIKLPAGEDKVTKKASEACRSLLPNGGNRGALKPGQLDKLRKMAQCLREHGIDVKDPTASDPRLNLPVPGGPKMKKAAEECLGSPVRSARPSK